MTAQDLLEKARQGEVGAIASLLNRALGNKGIVARVSRSHTRLKIMLESEHVPDADTLTSYLKTSLTKLAAPNLHTVAVYGRQTAATTPAWSRTFALPEVPAPPAAPSPNLPPSHASSRSTVRPFPVAPSRRRSQPARWPQILGGSLLAVILIMVGANLRSLHNYLTGTPNFAATVGTDGRYEAPIVQSIHGIPVIQVNFEDQTFPMMVDTGASGTLITPAMATALAVRPIGQVVSATANGMVTFDVGYVRSIEVDGAKVYNVPVAIGLPDLEMGLLGHDFFQYFDVVIREDVVEFHPRSL